MTYTELDVQENDSELPKINVFVKELTNWLGLTSICMFVIYGILYIVYEVALDLTHVRWAFTFFLVCCTLDVITYWICRFAVSGTETILLWLVLVSQCLTGLFYLLAPIIVLCTYRFFPEKSMMPGEVILEENEEKMLHTLEDYVDPDPCREGDSGFGDSKKEPLWQCGYVKSIRTAVCCMWISVVPKILICYLLGRILAQLRRK